MSAPVKHTCPDIDAVIKTIKGVEHLCKLSGTEAPEDLVQIIDEISSDLWGLDGDIERLRIDNSQLREWGEQLESDLNDAEEKLEELKQEIEKL